jgi:anti-anti-sigma regulatory factor
MAGHSFELRSNRLLASGDFSHDSDTGFDEACQKLLACPDRELIADLSGTSRMSSTYVGVLAEVCLTARGQGRKVIIRARPRLAGALRAAGLGTAAAIEEVG